MKFKSASSNSQATSWIHELRVNSTSYEFEFTSYEINSTSYEFQSTSYEFEFMRIIKSIKTQINSFKSSLFFKIISPKIFDNLWGNLYVQFLMITSFFTFPLLYGYGWVCKHWLWKKRPKLCKENSPSPLPPRDDFGEICFFVW